MKVFLFFMKYIFLFFVAGVFIYWAIGADNWSEAILMSALAAFDIYLGLSNIFGKKDE